MLGIIGRSPEYAIELLGSDQAVLALVLILDHADQYMQAHVSAALGVVARCGGADVVVAAGALPPLQRMIEHGETERVREAATTAVCAIQLAIESGY